MSSFENNYNKYKNLTKYLHFSYFNVYLALIKFILIKVKWMFQCIYFIINWKIKNLGYNGLTQSCSYVLDLV